MTFIVLSYAVIAFLFIRPIAGHFAWSFLRDSPSYKHNPRPDPEQWFAAFCLALLCGVFWPLAAGWVIMSPSRLGRAVGSEKEAQVKELQRKLIAAEKELGIQ